MNILPLHIRNLILNVWYSVHNSMYNKKSNIVNPLEIDTHLLSQLGLQVTGQIEFSIIG